MVNKNHSPIITCFCVCDSDCGFPNGKDDKGGAVVAGKSLGMGAGAANGVEETGAGGTAGG